MLSESHNRNRDKDHSKLRSLGISLSGIPDGGAAYARPRSDGIDPETNKPYVAWAQNGMTFRDAVAIAALPAILAAMGRNIHGGIMSEQVARACYEVSDAFLKERVK